MSGETAILEVDKPDTVGVGNGSLSEDLSNGSTSFEGSVVSSQLLAWDVTSRILLARVPSVPYPVVASHENANKQVTFKAQLTESFHLPCLHGPITCSSLQPTNVKMLRKSVPVSSMAQNVLSSPLGFSSPILSRHVFSSLISLNVRLMIDVAILNLLGH